MTTLQSNGYQIVFVKVPEDVTNIQLSSSLRRPNVLDLMNSTLVYTFAKDHQGYEHLDGIYLGSEGYRILGPGLSTLCSEEDAAKVVACEERSVLVDFNAGGGGRMKCNVYKDYEHGEYAFDDALTSLASLIRSQAMKPETTVVLIKANK